MEKNKVKGFLFKIEESSLEEYKLLCKKNGLNMSQRIRNFINEEIKKLKEDVQATNN